MTAEDRASTPRSTSQVLSLLGHLYTATVDPGRWVSFLGALEELFDASASLVTYFDAQHQMATLGITHNLPAQHLQDLIVHAGDDPRGPYNLGQPWHPGLNPRWHPDAPPDWSESWDYHAVSTDRMFCTDEFLHASAFYRDFLAPLSIEYSAGLILHNERYVAGCGIFRPPGAPAFAPRDLELLAHLAPHVNQAMRLHREFTSLQFANDALALALDGLSIGIAIVDSAGLVLHVNEAALSVCGQRDGIGYLNQRLTFDDDAVAHALLQTIARAQDAQKEPQLLYVPRISRRPPYSLLVMPAGGPFARAASTLSIGPRWLVFISDPAVDASMAIEVFRALYGLTSAETRVLALLVQGMRVEDISRALKVSDATVRGHIKKLFDKTHTRRQPDLIGKVLSCPAWVIATDFGFDGSSDR